MTKEIKPVKSTECGREEAYRLAKLLRAGSRELARQKIKHHTKKTRKQR